MEWIAEAVDALLGAGFFLVTPGTAEGSVKLVVVKSLLESLCLHDLGVLFRAMRDWADVLGDAVWIDPDQELEPDFLGHALAERDHFVEFPARVDMHERERDFAGKEGFLGEPEHDGGVFADGIEHDRVLEFGGDFPDDMDAFSFELLQMGEAVGFHQARFRLGPMAV